MKNIAHSIRTRTAKVSGLYDERGFSREVMMEDRTCRIVRIIPMEIFPIVPKGNISKQPRRKNFQAIGYP
jgi:hypothetical protein